MQTYLYIFKQLWEVYKERRLIRTYSGHAKAVKDSCFNNNGEKFLTAAYDRFVKLWDTETGMIEFYLAE